MQKSALLAAIQQEIQRHDFRHFVENPPSVAEGGKGVVVGGCPACRKRLNSMSQFHSKIGRPKRVAPFSDVGGLREGKSNCFRQSFLR
jgi:hypothetical protein